MKTTTTTGIDPRWNQVGDIAGKLTAIVKAVRRPAPRGRSLTVAQAMELVAELERLKPGAKLVTLRSMRATVEAIMQIKEARARLKVLPGQYRAALAELPVRSGA